MEMKDNPETLKCNTHSSYKIGPKLYKHEIEIEVKIKMITPLSLKLILLTGAWYTYMITASAQVTRSEATCQPR